MTDEVTTTLYYFKYSCCDCEIFKTNYTRPKKKKTIL